MIVKGSRVVTLVKGGSLKGTVTHVGPDENYLVCWDTRDGLWGPYTKDEIFWLIEVQLEQTLPKRSLQDIMSELNQEYPCTGCQWELDEMVQECRGCARHKRPDMWEVNNEQL